MPQREKPRLTVRRPPPLAAAVDSFVEGTPSKKTRADGLVVALPEEVTSKLTDICSAEGIDVDAAVLEAVSAWIEADPAAHRFDW